MNTLNKNIIIKYICILLPLIVIALILSLDNTPSHRTKNYFLESKPPKILIKPDFASMKNFKQRKAAFINFMFLGIQVANLEICLQRQQLNKLIKSYNSKRYLNVKQTKKLKKYLKYYRVDNSLDLQDQFKLLNKRIGSVPTSILLAQAILESGWGTSRFAKDYNNYFGLHCASEDCGVKALAANVYLEIFSNIDQNILGYYHRLNIGSKFKKFRIIRLKVNNYQLPIDALFKTFESYSEIGISEYQKRLESLIKQNNLLRYNTIKYC
jgi:uncharacterized FlgJ-related protein